MAVHAFTLIGVDVNVYPRTASVTRVEHSGPRTSAQWKFTIVKECLRKDLPIVPNHIQIRVLITKNVLERSLYLTLALGYDQSNT